MGQVVSKCKFDLHDILAIKEHWQGMTVKKLAKECLLSEEETRSIIAEYRIRDDDFQQFKFRSKLIEDFKGEYTIRYIDDCLRDVIKGKKNYGDDSVGNIVSNRGNARRNILLSRENLISKLATYLLVKNFEWASERAKEGGVSASTVQAYKENRVKDTDRAYKRFMQVFGLDDEGLELVKQEASKWEFQELLGLHSNLYIDKSLGKLVAEYTVKEYGYSNVNEMLENPRFNSIRKNIHYTIYGSKTLTIFSAEKIRGYYSLDKDKWLELLSEYVNIQKTEDGRTDAKLLLRYYKELHNYER